MKMASCLLFLATDYEDISSRLGYQFLARRTMVELLLPYFGFIMIFSARCRHEA